MRLLLIFLFSFYASSIFSQATFQEYFEEGEKAYQKENYNEALAFFTKASALEPSNYAAMKMLADSQHKLDRFKDAIKTYNLAQKLNPEDAVLYFDRGAAKVFLNDFKGAIKDFDKSIGIDPEVAEVYFFKAFSNAELGNYISAIEDYNRAIELKPNYSEAIYNRGAAKGELGSYENAMQDFNAALEIDPVENGYLNIALSHLGMKEYEKAIQSFDEVIKMRNVNLAKAYFYRGEAYFDIEQTTKACADWERANNLDFPQAKANLADYCGSSPKKSRTKEIDIVF